MKHKLRWAGIVVVLIVLWCSAANAESVEVTYIANEGFLLTSGTQKVLVDALFDEGFGTYLTPSSSTKDKLTRAKPPFDDIDVILVTHWHDDHFNAKMVAAHLEANRGATLVAPAQVVTKLKETKHFEKVSQRVMETTPAYGSTITRSVNEVTVTVFGMKHAPYMEAGKDRHSDVQNMGYLVSLDGVTLFHPGDGLIDLETDFVTSTRFDEQHIDILFLEYFDRSQGAIDIVTSIVRPTKIIGMHIPPKQIEVTSEVFPKTYPSGFVFNKSMERLVIEVDSDER